MTFASPTKRPIATRLIDEMRLYLIAVETFRAEGCEPHWSPLGELERAARPGRLEAGGNLISITQPRRHR
jgi:hypothetical protein